MVSDRLALLLCADFSESVTWTVSAVMDVAAVGVPLMVPVEALSYRPAGNAPLVIDQV